MRDDDSLPLEALERIDEICHQFEAAWIAGESPSLETYLNKGQPSDREQLLCQLIRLELVYGKKSGQGLRCQDYLDKFPEYKSVIQEAFPELPLEAENCKDALGKLSQIDSVEILKQAQMREKDVLQPTVEYKPELVNSQVPSPRRSMPMDGADYSTGPFPKSLVRSPTGATLNPRSGLEIIPGYTLKARLGKGAFGEVWKANGPGGVPVALKLLSHDDGNTALESRALAFMKFVNHPHLVTIHGIWDHANFMIIGMELADRTLIDRLCEACSLGLPGIPLAELIEYVREAAKAIDFLNEPRHLIDNRAAMRIIHRDIKPSNLLLVGGSIKVADVGLARALELSLGTATIGLTPAYAPPEFFLGEITPFSDQYSLAVTYCQLRTGSLPFSSSPLRIIDGHLNRALALDNLPRQERATVARALSRHPQDRWPNCRTFVEELLEVSDSRREHADNDWGFVLVDTTPICAGFGRIYSIRYIPAQPVCVFLAEVFNLIADGVQPFSYGQSWALRETLSGRVLDVGTAWARYHGFVEDQRCLRDVGIAPGVRLETIPLYAHH